MSEEKKPLKPIHKYTLQDYTTIKGGKMLVKDGQPVKCHKCGPQIVPSGLSNQLVPVYEHCTTHCSRAILALENELLVYLQTCEVQGQKFPIDNAEAAPKLNLVK